MSWISALWPFLLLGASLAATIYFAARAAATSQRWPLWAAVFSSWLGSFLASWSIGLLTLVVTFVLLALAVSHTFGWLTSAPRALVAAGCGVAAWWILIHSVDDYWLFFPLGKALELLVG